MSQLTLNAPAKLNLYLKVINKRPDGFHNIKTLFERINLIDRVGLKDNTRGEIRITCNHPHVPLGSKNLVYRVADLMRTNYGMPDRGVDIDIQKVIPVAAGLAGGSTNAAAVIMGLNRLWRLKLQHKDLIAIARQIGSDVPFFLYDTSWAMGTERGDKIRPLKIDRKLWHILVVPKVKMHTPKVYGAIKIGKKEGQGNIGGSEGTNLLTKPGDNANILVHKLRNSNIINISSLLYNDLEKVVVQICPRIKKLKEKLKSLNAMGVTVSGSGPSVYGLTDSETAAKQIQAQLSNRYTQVFVVRTF